MNPFPTFLLSSALLLASDVAGQDFLDLPWSTSEDGRLQWQSDDPQYAGEWCPLFPGLLDGTKATLSENDEHLNYGPFLLLPLLLHGDGGAAAIDEAPRRLRKLNIRASFAPHSTEKRDPDPLRDLLRVRYLGELDVLAANVALAYWAGDGQRDRTVRAAAFGELRSCRDAESFVEQDDVKAARIERNGAAALHAGLQRLPDDFGMLIGVHSAALPTAGGLLQAWRRFHLRFSSAVVMSAGGSIGPVQYAEGQRQFDYPGQLPYELAVRLGNWRVDHALIALRSVDPGQWWFHLGGAFQIDRLETGLRASGFEVERDDDGELRTMVCGWRLRATATGLEGWQDEVPVLARGSHVPEFAVRAAEGSPPLWLHVRAEGRLALLVSRDLQSLDVSFDPATRQLRGEARCRGEDGAKSLQAAWRAWQQERRCDPDAKIPGEQDVTWGDAAKNPPGCAEYCHSRLAWRRCVQAVQSTTDGDRVSWSCDLTPFPLDDLVRLLAATPRQLCEDG